MPTGRPKRRRTLAADFTTVANYATIRNSVALAIGRT